MATTSPKLGWRPDIALWALFLSLLQVFGALLIFTRGFKPEVLTWLAFQADLEGYSFSTTADIFVANAAGAAFTLVLALVCRWAPLFVYARMTRLHFVWSSGIFHSLLATYALVKVFGAPAEDDWFWGGNVLLFSCCTCAGFMLSTLADGVHGWAASAAAVKVGLPSPAEAGADSASTGGKGSGEDGEGDKPKVSRASLGRLLSLSRPDLSYILLGFANLCVAAVAGTFTPHFVGSCIDAIANGDTANFRMYILYLLGASVVQAIFTGGRGWCFTIALARLKVRLRDRLFRALMAQEQAFFDTTSTGELTSRLASDTTAVGDQISLNVNVFARSIISAVGSLVFMFALSWRLSLLAFCTVPPTVIISQVYGRWIQTLSRRSQQRLADCNRVAEEALGSMLTVRAFGCEQREADRHAEILADYYQQNRAQADGYAWYAAATTLIPSTVTSAVLYVGGHLIGAGTLSSGTLISFLLYQLTLAGAFASISDIWSGLQSAVGAADKIFSLLDRVPRMALDGTRLPTLDVAGQHTRDSTRAGTEAALGVVSRAGTDIDEADTGEGAVAVAMDARFPLYNSPRPPIFGRIDLENVRFAYPSRPEVMVLDGFSLTLLPGQTVALVGMSGGGKSSICKLVQRLYEPLSGRVLLDGVPVGEYDHEWLHSACSVVNQEPVLFARSIWENVAYGVDVDTEETSGGSRALLLVPPSAAPDFVHYRPSGDRERVSGSADRSEERIESRGRPTGWLSSWIGGWRGRDRGSSTNGYSAIPSESPLLGESRGPSGSTGTGSIVSVLRIGGHMWARDLSIIDNTPTIITLSVARGRLVGAYRAVEGEARRALRVERRLALAEKAGLLHTSYSGRSTAGSGAVRGAGRVRTAEAALAALCPQSAWEEGGGRGSACRRGGQRAGRDGKGSAPKSLAESERSMRRQRQVREWIRRKRETEGWGQTNDADGGLAELLKAWHGTGARTKQGQGEGVGQEARGEEKAEDGEEEEEEEGDEDEDSSLTLPTFTPTPAAMRSIVAAATAANAHAFVSGMPDGYDTQVGERGISLSGGQKQRVAIARAVLRHPSVLLLDEATSALDAESEFLVQTALDGLMAGRTVLVIAHRLSTVRRADVICVVQHGRVVESGRHEELVGRADGAYASLVKRQLEQAALQPA